MVLTLSQVRNIYNVLNGLDQIRAPIATGYKFACILDALEKDYNFYVKTFESLIKRYGKYDENNQLIYSEEQDMILLKEETIDEAKQKIQELQTQSVDLELQKINLSELKDLALTIEEIKILLPILENNTKKEDED